jgi:hypothetical protein
MNGKWILLVLCWGLGCGLARAVVVMDRDYRHQIRMTSRADVKKSAEDSYTKAEKGTTLTDTDKLTKTQHVTLSFDIQNRANKTLDAELKWCFIRDSSKKGGGVGILLEGVGSAWSFGGKKMSLNAGESVNLSATGDFVSLLETSVSLYENTTTSTEKSKTREYDYGDKYLGYVAVLIVDGRAVAKAANLSSFLDDKWVEQCAGGALIHSKESVALTSSQIKKLKRDTKFGEISLAVKELGNEPVGYYGKLSFDTYQPTEASSGLDENYPKFMTRLLCELACDDGGTWLIEYAGQQSKTDEDYVGADEWQIFVKPETFKNCTISAYVLQYGMVNDGEFVPLVEKKKNVESGKELLARNLTKFPGKLTVRHSYTSVDDLGEETQSSFKVVKSRSIGKWK